ncbi:MULTISPECIES: sulfurtransferase TusA family protein [Dethiosulfovibrio]|uniref:Sulfurtransferase TusA family protein n=2 Tax=Dethiosulfovibrio TaxID=47054 RepID=A0ABS9EQ34_9BACT|nr:MULTISPECIES: sulfurtransferase TusA family protein [Dethiosulfovibrio]MCF4114179.1 sulfurtransferase TusA family protein [Dethiosulfovibrio russensis]MCF4142631.1 sulfurtransferase TusA family protein [Dethiosulfovibrio marinus]MCF4145150.1 sulfurtransferase TusA family protein [Dethiosulfovibrio acidaminovorans]
MAKEYTLDCLGEACPIPLIKAQKKMAEMSVGDTITIEIDHSCAVKNIPEWANKEGYNCEIEEIDDGQWEIWIEKTK